MRFSLIVYFIFFTSLVFSQKNKAFKKEVLPKNSLFEPVFLDPLECTPYLSFLGYSETTDKFQKIYVPFSMAMQKIVFAWKKDSLHGFELGFDASAFTQFEWIMVKDTWQRNILNSDFKGSGFFNYKYNQWVFRSRLYHISSHLGDDYIIRNKIRSYTPNAVNYEQLDINASYYYKNIRLYGAVGMVVRPNTIRKRFSSQMGFLFNQPFKNNKLYHFITGADIKIMEQNQYQPNVKIASGLQIAKLLKNPVSIVFEYYQGHLPYSVFEKRKVKWYGLSFYFSPL